jgi:hypothetical protein
MPRWGKKFGIFLHASAGAPTRCTGAGALKKARPAPPKNNYNYPLLSPQKTPQGDGRLSEKFFVKCLFFFLVESMNVARKKNFLKFFF